jgi:hypothetical protein
VRTDYDYKKYDIEYHDKLDGLVNEGSWLQHNGKIEFYPWTKMTSAHTYNDKNYYKYGNKIYVPSYEDSIYLSYKGGKSRRNFSV